jgi:membrane fusion protein (multidrug efflux system)
MKEGSCSFLKKRTKKLLSVPCRTAPTRVTPQPMSKSFLLLFFKKEVLPFFFVCAAPAYAQEPPSVVSTMAASYSTWQDHLQAVGSVRAVRGADLAAEVSGVVDWVGFDSGADVAAGTVLMKLRANDDGAKLNELQAAAELAASNLARDQKQFRAQAVSQATLDADESRLRQARAQVAQQQALMEEKVVRAPFAGRLGLRQVDVGQYLTAGTTVVTLQALDQVYVDFYVPQQALSEVHVGEEAEVTVDAFPGRTFAAKLTAISPKLDQASRMAQLRATIANANHVLLPGMFTSVTLPEGVQHRYITLPQSALVYNPYGSTVYVADNGHPMTVHTVLVKTGPTRGDQVAVLEGLQAGEIVVTAGQLKLHQGSTIEVNNSVQPPDQAAPHPAEE